MVRHPGIFRGGVVLGIPVPEPLWENLVPDSLLRPSSIGSIRIYWRWRGEGFPMSNQGKGQEYKPN